ncbi:MAG: guanylate kinase [Candidatus Omnitrophota bacterium]|nr:guanylate kinase [Candidatus Omnitrophota bacterium]
MAYRPGKLFILSGPSGSGKTTLYKKLLKRKALGNRLIKAISYTTRARRENEKDGRDYLFISRKEFLKKKRQGEFLESQNIFGFLYGTPKDRLRALLNSSQNVLLCIDVKGAKEVKRLYPSAVSIFVLPPSFKTLNQRLESRSTEGARQLQRRLVVAKKEIAVSKSYDHRVVNDNLKEALNTLEGIIIKKLKE